MPTLENRELNVQKKITGQHLTAPMAFNTDKMGLGPAEMANLQVPALKCRAIFKASLRDALEIGHFGEAGVPAKQPLWPLCHQFEGDLLRSWGFL